MDRTKGRTEVTYEPSHRNSAVKRTTVKFEWVSQAHFRYFYILTSGVVLGPSGALFWSSYWYIRIGFGVAENKRVYDGIKWGDVCTTHTPNSMPTATFAVKSTIIVSIAGNIFYDSFFFVSSFSESPNFSKMARAIFKLSQKEMFVSLFA